MKKVLLIPFVLLICSCATSFNSINKNDTYADNLVENDQVKIVLGFQGLGKNNRFRDNFEQENIALLRLSITNKSDKVINIKEEDINLKLKDKNMVVLPLEAKTVSNRVSLAAGPYWFWGLLWFGYTECNGNDCESSWYPVGLIIGAINFFRATSTNTNMENELVNNSFKGSSLNPGEELTGYVFYDASQKRYYEMQINYQLDNEEKNQIIVPYSF